MNDFTKLTPLAAVQWFEQHRTTLGVTDAALTIEKLLALGISDTDLILEFGRTAVLDDLDTVPGLEPTVDNLRLLLAVGPDVMRGDPDNAGEWQALAQKYSEPGEDPYDVLAAFLEAGRGPSYARQVLDLVERTNSDTTNQKPRGYWEVSDFDLTQPYALLADMAAGGFTEPERRAWAAAGFELADAIKLSGEGLSLDRIAILKHHGVPREEWTGYVRIPLDWIDNSRSTFIPVNLPDGVTLDLLALLASNGWQRHRIVPPGRGTRHYPHVWQAYYAGQPVTLTEPQIGRLLAADLTSHTITNYYLEARKGAARSEYKDEPGPLLNTVTGRIAPDTLDEFITEAILCAEAKVRPSHLSTYRWVGCKTLAECREAAKAGITEVRAKQLRSTYGRKVGWSGSTVRRIDTLKDLLEIDRKDREPTQAVTM